MDYYQSTKRHYNDLNEKKIKYPTKIHLQASYKLEGAHGQSTYSNQAATSGGGSQITSKNVLSFESKGYKPLDVRLLPYEAQKEFFRLDKASNQAMVDKNAWKVKKTKDNIRVGLMANLRRDRINIFR